MTDREFLWRLHEAAMRSPVEHTWGWDKEFQLDYFDENFEPRKRRIISVEDEDIGVLQTEWRTDSLFLANIEILPSRQGHGIGARIARDLLVRARRESLPVTLQVLKENPRALRFYEWLGFVITGETETRYHMSTTGAPDAP